MHVVAFTHQLHQFYVGWRIIVHMAGVSSKSYFRYVLTCSV